MLSQQDMFMELHRSFISKHNMELKEKFDNLRTECKREEEMRSELVMALMEGTIPLEEFYSTSKQLAANFATYLWDIDAPHKPEKSPRDSHNHIELFNDDTV